MDIPLNKSMKKDKIKKISEDLQLRFLKRLSRLLFEGYPIIEALEIIKWDKQMIIISNRIIVYLKSSLTLDEALEKVYFHSTITSYLYFVNSNGNLQENLDRCIAMFEERLKYKKKIQDIARYPLILMFVFSILLFFIKTTVLPSFIQLFQSNINATKTIKVFSIIIDYGLIIAGFIGFLTLVLSVFWQQHKKTLSIEKRIVLYKKIPLYRKILSLQVSFQFSMYLSTMLKSGKALKDILISMEQQKKQPIISHYARIITEKLSLGLDMSSILRDLYFLDHRISMVFQKNIDVKALEKDLMVYSDLLIDELERNTLKLLTLIQPIIFIALACFVVFIYLTLMLPMYQIIKAI